MMGNSLIDRRKFLGWGTLGGVLLVAGCSEEGAPQNVTTPPAEKGNRNLIKKKAEPPPIKGKKN